MYELTIELDGDQLEPEAFAKAVLTFVELLKSTDRTLANGKISVGWRIARLSYASPALVSVVGSPRQRGQGDLAPAVGRKVLDSIRALEAGKRPEAFSDSALEKAKTLAEFGQGKRGFFISISENPDKPSADSIVRLTPQTAASVDRFIGPAYESFGAVQGRLEVVSSRQGFACVVHDEVGGKAVKCAVPEHLIKDVLKHFDARVLVTGRIRRDATGIPRTMSLDAVEALPEGTDLPQSLAGIAPDFTGDDSTVDYLRERWEGD